MNDPEKVIDTAFRDLDHAHFVVTEQQARIAELEAQVGRLRAALENVLSDRFEDHAACGDTGECEQGCVKCGHERDAEAAVRDAAHGKTVQG